MSKTSRRRTPFNDFRTSYRPMRRIRRSLDMTQVDLAAAVGVHWTNISRIENGHVSPSDHTMTAIARALGVRRSELTEHLPLEDAPSAGA